MLEVLQLHGDLLAGEGVEAQALDDYSVLSEITRVDFNYDANMEGGDL